MGKKTSKDKQTKKFQQSMKELLLGKPKKRKRK